MVYIAVSKSDLFPFRADVCKSCSLSAVLFIIYMDRILDLPSEKVLLHLATWRCWTLYLQMTLSYWHHWTVIFGWRWDYLKQKVKCAWKTESGWDPRVSLTRYELCGGWMNDFKHLVGVPPCTSPWGGVSGMSSQEDTQTQTQDMHLPHSSGAPWRPPKEASIRD